MTSSETTKEEIPPAELEELHREPDCFEILSDTYQFFRKEPLPMRGQLGLFESVLRTIIKDLCLCVHDLAARCEALEHKGQSANSNDD